MKYILILSLFFTLSCSLNKVKNNHGVFSLENKISKIKINKSNTNDIILHITRKPTHYCNRSDLDML